MATVTPGSPEAARNDSIVTVVGSVGLGVVLVLDLVGVATAFASLVP